MPTSTWNYSGIKKEYWCFNSIINLIKNLNISIKIVYIQMQLLVQLQAAYLTDLNELPQEQKKKLNWDIWVIPSTCQFFDQIWIISKSISEFKIRSEGSRRFKRFNDAKRVKRRYGGRNAYFYIYFYKIWREKIHIIIKILSDAKVINRLRTNMP